MADSTSVEKKTEKSATPAPIGMDTANGAIRGATGSNVLHKYKSYTYLFTLSTLKRDDAYRPETYRDSALDYVILRSSGKGTKGIDPSKAVPVPRTMEVKEEKRGTATTGSLWWKKTVPTVTTSTTKVDYLDSSGNALISEFNQKSPGRFDMFVDNVEVETVMSSDGQSGVTQPTKVIFDVIEPYSISGFLESMHVASIAAGYASYHDATFLLKMEVVGYPDGDEISDPIYEKNAVRYFPIQLSNVEVSVDEKGTKYNVTAVPLEQKGFGNPSEIKMPVKISGGTVQSILQNLVQSVEKQAKEHDQSISKTPLGADSFDEYKIRFPEWNDTTGWSDGVKIVNKLAGANVTELLKDSASYKFPDAGTNKKPTANQPKDQKNPTPEQSAKHPEVFKLSPGASAVQFPEGKKIHECITSIIKDSHYIRDILEKLSSPSEWQTVVKDNMIDYFLIKMEVENKQSTSKEKKRPYQIYTFVVTPFKILYTRIPNYGNNRLDMEKLSKQSMREYNYIYTGKNIDVTNFKLNFNNMFFEAVPVRLGNTGGPPSRNSAAPTDKPNIKSTTSESDIDRSQETGLPGHPVQTTADLTNNMENSGGQTQQSAYFAMAQAMHSAVVDSTSNMLTGEIEIVGDPFYIVTGGIGNYSPKPSKASPRETQDGEASFNYGEVLITINFMNPIDIQPLEQGGQMFFEPEKIPFSGVYMVTTCKSAFKGGAFKQTLQIVRVPGQSRAGEVSNKGKNKPTDPTARISQAVNRRDTVVQDATPAEPAAPGQRPDELNLWNQLNRGLPSPGLPGYLSNFTAATGGLGGTVSAVAGSNLNLAGASRLAVGISAVSGATPNLAGAARLAGQGFGGSIPGGQFQPAFGMPLPARAAVGLQNRVYSPGGYVQQLASTLANSFGISGAPRQLLDQFVGIQARKVSQLGVIGSGIGAGANVQIIPSALPIGNNPIQGLNSNMIGATSSMPDRGAGLVGDVTSRLRASTQGSNADPHAIAPLFGVDQSQLSGLSPNLQSKVLGQLSGIASNIPADTNLATAAAQGINLNGMSYGGISRLPPSAPYAVAQQPRPDIGALNSIVAYGGPTALARSYGANNISEISQTQLSGDTAQEAMSNSPSIVQKYASRLGVNNLTDAAVLGAKLYAERKSLMGPTGIPGSLEGNFIGVRNQLGPVNIVGDLGSSVVNKFGSRSAGTSPLDKIMIR